MSILILILIVAALASLFGGIFITGLKALLWVALGLAALAIIVWAMRTIADRPTRGIRR